MPWRKQFKTNKAYNLWFRIYREKRGKSLREYNQNYMKKYRKENSDYRKRENENGLIWIKKFEKKFGIKYYTIHNWVKRNFGLTKKCENCKKLKTSPHSIQWSNVSGKYLKKRKDWKQLCASCHKRFDLKLKKQKFAEQKPI